VRQGKQLAAVLAVVMGFAGAVERVSAQETGAKALPVGDPAAPSAAAPAPAEMKWTPATHIPVGQAPAPRARPAGPPAKTPPKAEAANPRVPFPDDGLSATPPAAVARMPSVQASPGVTPDPLPPILAAGEVQVATPPGESVANVLKPPTAAAPQGGGSTAQPAGFQSGPDAASPGPVHPSGPPPASIPPMAEAPAAGPHPDNRPAGSTVTGPQQAAVHVETIGPTALNQGKPLSYEIVVRNTGAVAVYSVRVEEDFPAGARLLRADPPTDTRGRLLTWNLESLEPGAERHFKIEAQTGEEGELWSCATATFSVSSGLRTRITQPRLTVTKTGPQTVQVGDPAAFHIQVTNTGTGAATNVVLHDKLPPGLKHVQGDDIEADLGTLEPGQSKDVTLETTATRAGRVVNEAVATADGDIRASAQAAVIVTEPLLALNKTGPQRRYMNRDAEFALDLSNPGTASASNVRVVDTLPPGLEFAAASDAGVYEPTTRTITWNIGTLAAGQKRTLTTKLSARAIGDLVNRAVATAERGLEAKAETALHVEGIPALMLEVVDLDDPVEVGAETTYEIHVVNQGTAPSTGLQILATVPDGMGPRGASGPTAYRIQGQQVIFEPLSALTPKADAMFRVRVVGQKPGDLRFKVQMSCDQLRVPVYEEESTRVYSD